MSPAALTVIPLLVVATLLMNWRPRWFETVIWLAAAAIAGSLLGYGAMDGKLVFLTPVPYVAFLFGLALFGAGILLIDGYQSRHRTRTRLGAALVFLLLLSAGWDFYRHASGLAERQANAGDREISRTIVAAVPAEGLEKSLARCRAIVRPQGQFDCEVAVGTRLLQPTEAGCRQRVAPLKNALKAEVLDSLHAQNPQCQIFEEAKPR